MRRSLTGLVIIAFIAAALALVTPAYGDGSDVTCQRRDPATGQCVITVVVSPQPGTDGTPAGHEQTGSGSACYWDPTKQGLTAPPAGPVDCSSIDGYWSNAHNCYIQVAQPPPPAGDNGWEGHEPGDGAVYNCNQPQTGILVQLWSADPPPGGGPTPGEVAQIAVDDMGLSAVDIGIAPKPGPDSVGLVGMPVWMWAAQPSPTTTGPTSGSATAGGITATATATLESITWDMGDGHAVVCDSAGQPYAPSYGRQASPDCGYTYKTTSSEQPGQHFTVTATSQWVVSWSGAGQTGTIRPAPLIRTTQITIGEAQVLVQ